jgi:hypothetical protein
MMDTPDRKPLGFKISRAMQGIDIDWLSNAIKSLCKGWITSHEDKETRKHTRNPPAALNKERVPVSHPNQGIFLTSKNVTLGTAI